MSDPEWPDPEGEAYPRLTHIPIAHDKRDGFPPIHLQGDTT